MHVQHTINSDYPQSNIPWFPPLRWYSDILLFVGTERRNTERYAGVGVEVIQ